MIYIKAILIRIIILVKVMVLVEIKPRSKNTATKYNFINNIEKHQSHSRLRRSTFDKSSSLRIRPDAHKATA
jgi:hypothetical protein